MTKIQQQITIQAPLDQVAAYTSDPAHLPEWNSMIVRVLDIRPTPEGVGTTWNVVVSILGREQQVTSRVTLSEPPARFGFELVGGAPGIPGLTSSMLVEARALPPSSAATGREATHLTCTLELHIPLLMGGGALAALASPLIKEQLHQSLSDLKRILESQH